MIRLGINIDHIATIRNARAENHPHVYKAARHVIKCGADLITVHLREDRRHIKDKDLKLLTKNKKIPINLEMAATNEMLRIALRNKPKFVCIVPEKRREITTEGGLNIKKNFMLLKKIVNRLNNNNIRTSLFINPTLKDIKMSKMLKVKCVELHTGKISRLIKNNEKFNLEYNRIKKASAFANKLDIEVHAGHGMDYKTAKILSKIKDIKEFNIGHFVVGESIFYGLNKVIKNFKKITK